MSENAEKNEADEEDFKSAKNGLEESEAEKVVSDHQAAAEDHEAQSVEDDKEASDEVAANHEEEPAVEEPAHSSSGLPFEGSSVPAGDKEEV